MRRLLLSLFLLSAVAAGRAGAAALPGFRLQLVGSTAGFLSSVAVDSRGTIYYTTTKGDLFRLDDGGQSMRVGHVDTIAVGDSGLLGMALRDDRTTIVHYTTPGQTADVVSSIDLLSGEEKRIASLIADIGMPSRGSPPEHHGGNPTVAADGTIFVAVGDYGGGVVASMPDWNGGKIFRIAPDGTLSQFARGVRNPFDLSWDAARGRLIAPDNGAAVDDEINIVHEGDYLGWPFTMGNAPPIDGATSPIYSFPTVVAPTGLAALSGRNPTLRHGYLLATFIGKSVLYIPDIDARPLPDPIPLFQGNVGMVIDVAEGGDGSIVVGSGNAVYRLIPPAPGDCNGDGLVDYADVGALQAALNTPSASRLSTTDDRTRSWGCDVNSDGLVDGRDMAALADVLHLRLRAVRH